MNVFKHLKLSVTLMVLVALIGSVGFKIFEKISFFDAFWLTVITVLTVGYGDAVPLTFEGKVFALLIIPISIGIVTYVIGSVTALIIEGEFSQAVRRRKMEKEIDKMNNHMIICGVGRVGEQVMLELQERGIQTVIIEQNEQAVTDNQHHIIGDATDEEVLIKAGIKRASGLITTLPNDAENVFITLTARELNNFMTIVARAEKKSTEEKLMRAGADRVITPHTISGKQMVLSLLKPKSVDYVDMMLHVGTKDYGFEEITLSKTSPIVGQTLKEAKVRTNFGVTVVAVLKENDMITNPSADTKLCENDRIIVFGSNEELQMIEQVIT